MKKLIAILLTMVMCLSMVACGGSDGPDRQPAIDAYVQTEETYNAFADVANQHLEDFTDEEIDMFNEVADVLNDFADILNNEEELTQEQLDEMVEILNSFDEDLTTIMEVYE